MAPSRLAWDFRQHALAVPIWTLPKLRRSPAAVEPLRNQTVANSHAGVKGVLPIADRLRAAAIQLAILLAVAAAASGQEQKFVSWWVNTAKDQFDETKDISVYAEIEGAYTNSSSSPSNLRPRIHFACLHGDEIPFATLTRPKSISFVSGVRIRYRILYEKEAKFLNASGVGDLVLIRGYQELLEDMKEGIEARHWRVLFEVTDSISFYSYVGWVSLRNLHEALDHAAKQGCKL